MGVMVFIAGTIMNGAQSSMPALAAGFYPTQGRATGVAQMLGLGRFGGILALSGAFLMQAELSFKPFSPCWHIPAVLSAIALMIKHVASKRQQNQGASGPASLPESAQKFILPRQPVCRGFMTLFTNAHPSLSLPIYQYISVILIASVPGPLKIWADNVCF